MAPVSKSGDRALAAGIGVDDRRHGAHRRYGEVIAGVLFALGEVHRLDGVRNAEFFEKNRDFEGVRRRPEVNLDGFWRLCGGFCRLGSLCRLHRRSLRRLGLKSEGGSLAANRLLGLRSLAAPRSFFAAAILAPISGPPFWQTAED